MHKMPIFTKGYIPVLTGKEFQLCAWDAYFYIGTPILIEMGKFSPFTWDAYFCKNRHPGCVLLVFGDALTPDNFVLPLCAVM